MIRYLKSNLIAVLTLAIASAPAVCLSAADAPEPDLLKHAQQLARFGTGDVQWATCLPSGNTVLFLRVTDSYDFNFVKRNLPTGTDTPLRALKKLYGSSLGYGYEVSPDGDWLLWKNSQNEILWSMLDGQHKGKINSSNSSNQILWMADSKHWVEFVDTQVFRYTRARINDIKIPDRPRLVNLLPQSPLAHQDRSSPPVTFDNALFSPSGHLLVARETGGNGLDVDILEMDVERQGLPTHQFTVHLPGDVGLSEIVFSPDGEHIGWLLRRGKLCLCVSRLNGSEMHLIGTLAITTKKPDSPDDELNAEPTALRWSSDGKSLTFLYQNTLYRVPASGSAAYAPMPPYLLISKDSATALERNQAEALESAIASADTDAVKRLIAGGTKVNYQDSESRTPLMYAASDGRTEIMKTLLAAEADPNLRDRYGDTALIMAIEANQDEAALLLLASGTRVNVKGYYGRTALLVETEKGSNRRGRGSADGSSTVVRLPSVNMVTALLDRGADVNLTGFEGAAPLIEATRNGSDSLVQLMVSRGADVNVRDEHGLSALLMAAIRGHIDLCTFLLDHGADPNAQETARQTNGETPLIHAAFLGSIELCKLLITRGAKVNMADPAGYTPLSNAVDNGNVELTRFLLDKGANPNVRFIDSYMLISAVLKNHKEIVELLLQRGADINAKGEYYGSGNPEQKTALGWARKQHLDDMVRLLSKAGAKE